MSEDRESIGSAERADREVKAALEPERGSSLSDEEARQASGGMFRNIYKCPYCDQYFLNYDQERAHISRVHPGKQ